MARKRIQPDPVEYEDRAAPDLADLARGADGLTEPVDPQEIAQGLIAAQLRAMNVMVAASTEMTAATMRAMSQIWGTGPKKGRGDRDGA